MESRDFNQFESSSNQARIQGLNLLSAGWRPLRREMDWNFLTNLVVNDSQELSNKTLNLVGSVANVLGRNNYAWWANLLNIFTQEVRYEVDEFWNYITPEPPYPDYRYKEVLSVEMPVSSALSRTDIPIVNVLNQLQEFTLMRVLELLDRPTLITQYYLDRHFYLPISRFVNWKRVEVINTVFAYWAEQDVWLELENMGRGRRQYILLAKDPMPLINKATYNVAIMLSGYQSRVGQIHAEYPIRSFPQEIQNFTDTVQQAVLQQDRLAVLVSGAPGTGKTAWTQAVAKEILAPLGYVVFILDHDGVENFVPPGYLERICLIVNEADNLAQDRASIFAQSNSRTEHILSLLDGTLYNSVVSAKTSYAIQQKLVVLMTCNTRERLDPAMLRKGRVDFTCEFTHRFV